MVGVYSGGVRSECTVGCMVGTGEREDEGVG